MRLQKIVHLNSFLLSEVASFFRNLFKVIFLILVMAGEPIIDPSIISKELLPGILDKLSPLITIFKALGIVLIVYFIFLILKALFSWKSASRVRRIAKNLEEINEKMDILISKQSSRKKEIPEKEEGKEDKESKENKEKKKKKKK